jgi:muconate cycloisomerase
MTAILAHETRLRRGEPISLSGVDIRSINATIVDAPTIRQHRLSNTSVSHQNYVHVRLQLENGVIGYGEASTLGGPRWAEESVESIKAAIDCYLTPVMVGRFADAFEANALLMNKAASRNNAAKSAIESAALDAVGRTLGVPAATLLGGAVRDRFPAIWVLASGVAGQEIEEAKSKIVDRTFKRFKIKLGFNPPAADIARLEAIRLALGDEIALIVDVNQAWSEADCLRWMPALEDLNVALVEQPLPAGKLEAMARVARRTRIPLMLDEAVFTSAEALRGGASGAGSVLSLKLVKSGSAFELKRTAGIAAAFGQELYGGCLLESSIGAAAHLAVFACLPTLEWGAEHFGPLVLSEDLAEESLVYDNYDICLPQGPGLGVTPDLDKIKALARVT